MILGLNNAVTYNNSIIMYFFSSNNYLVLTVCYRKIEEKLLEPNILDLSQNTSNLSLQNLRTEMDDSVLRETEDILNMMQLFDVE